MVKIINLTEVSPFFWKTLGPQKLKFEKVMFGI
jgi:hypothetical protein